MANLGTLTCYVPQTGRAPTGLYGNSNSGYPPTPKVRYASARRPVAWWRGGTQLASTTSVAYWSNVGTDLTALLTYPDNGRFIGITEQNFARDGYVKVALFYYPTMTLIGWARSDALGNWQMGYKSSPPIALDTTDAANYAAVAFDPSRTYNLVGFDDLTAVT